MEGWAKATTGPYLQGDAPSVADFVLASLYLGNGFTQDEAFKELPWRHVDVIEKYPATKKAIDAVLALPAVAASNDTPMNEASPSINMWNGGIAKNVLGKQLNAGRTFAVTGPEGGPMVHPNAVKFVPGAKEHFDKPQN